jgi:hypothetical protein
VRVEVDDYIHVAARFVVVVAQNGAKNIQPTHAMLPAQGGDQFAAILD